jgi:uncharacterized protein (TIGR03083 family)
VRDTEPISGYTWGMDYLRSIQQDGELFYTTASDADPARGVPCCPDWLVGDLVWHLGEVQWFWAAITEQRATAPEQVEAGKPARPRTYAETIAWGRSQLDRLAHVLQSTPDNVPVWTWAPDESRHNVGFIRRHQVQEAAVHRWDIQSAASDRIPDPIDPEAASDSIDELLSVSLPFGVSHSKPLSGTVHIHCTDVGGEWFIERDGSVDRAHATGDVAMRGTASDLLLVLYNRIDVEVIDVTGNESLARHLVERIETD